jgi:predicted nucleic acid-binding protein
VAKLLDRAIVDASVAVKWVVPEAGSDRAAALATCRLAAPDLLDAECANVLWVKVTRGELSETDALTRIAHLVAAPVDRVPCREVATAALKLSIELGHPAYDCLYLALAIRTAVPLVTADAKFLKAVASHPYLAPSIVGLDAVGRDGV